MESRMLVGLLVHPVALALLFAVAFGSVALWGAVSARALLSRRRLLCGLAGVVLAAVVATAASSYASPEEARQFGVPEAHRWSAMWQQFVVQSVLALYVGVVGASLVGIPLALFMARRGVATVLWFVLASIPISLLLGALLHVLTSPPFLERSAMFLIGQAAFLVGSHAWLAFGFAVGAGLPWRTSTRGSSVA